MSESTETIESNLVRLQESISDFYQRFHALKAQIGEAIVGYDQLITDVLIAVFSQGHVLLEGVPGLGKTYLVRVLSSVLGLNSGRVQCTPDLMPADVLGTHVFGENEQGRHVFRFEKGPVFHNLLLVDEINRATPKTQAALLEVMQEHAVTAGGERFELPTPFFVLATQNPLEMEGTYPLPEAQLDRFLFKLHVPFPSAEELVEISKRTTGFHEKSLDVVMTGTDMIFFQELLTHVPIADSLAHYAAQLVLATHPENAPEHISCYIAYGAGPRAMQALIRGARGYCLLGGRTAVSVNDLKQAAKPALRHRMLLNFEGEARQISVDSLIDEILSLVPTPADSIS